MHYLYIIYSASIDKYYIGESHDIIERLKLHNSHRYDKSFTKAADDWKLKLSKVCDNRENALFLEKFIKQMKSRKFVEKIIGNPDILEDLLRKR